MAGRTPLEEGNRRCPECGETKDRLSRHWSFCEFPTVDDDLRALLTGVLLGGGTLQGNGENTQHLLVQTTSEQLARWLFRELDWLAHSLGREIFEGEREPIYRVRTHGHTFLRWLRDAWYRDGKKRIQADTSLTPRSARVWWALAGGLEWTGPHDSQVRGTVSAEADARAEAIASVLETAGFKCKRLDRRVVIYRPVLREWLAWIGEPVPGVEHKWALHQDVYDVLRGHPLTAVLACPDCDSTAIFGTLSGEYSCHNCDSQFSEPVVRPSRSSQYDDEEIITAVRAAIVLKGHDLSSEDYRLWARQRDGIPGKSTVVRQIGWSAARDAADWRDDNSGSGVAEHDRSVDTEDKS